MHDSNDEIVVAGNDKYAAQAFTCLVAVGYMLNPLSGLGVAKYRRPRPYHKPGPEVMQQVIAKNKAKQARKAALRKEQWNKGRATMGTKVLYDVCNDYSLDQATDQTIPDQTVYSTAKRYGGLIFIHRKYNEIHYFLGEPGLDGKYL